MSDRPSVLVVEDDHDIRALLAISLQLAGFTVRAEPDGEAALAAVAARPPDLVLLDWMMPGLDGLELCRRLRAHPETAGLPLLVLTARARRSDADLALAAGADAYLAKPFTRAELTRSVWALLDAQRPHWPGGSPTA